jgi:phosphoserine phosphatase
MLTTIIHSADLSNSHINAINILVPGDLKSSQDYYRLEHKEPLSHDQRNELRKICDCDVNPLPEDYDPQAIRLLITDMDSTLINIECIDEIADHLGIKGKVAAITEAAMRGEIDFATSLTRRVALLEGIDVEALKDVYDNRLQLNPGAQQLLDGLKALDIKVALVSGGFTFFTDQLEERLGLDFTLANVLDINNGKLTGKVLGDIVDATGKAQFLARLCEQLGVATSHAIAVGDGANDLEMMGCAGLSVAYHAKPAVQEQALTAINCGGLDSILAFLG